MNVVLVRVGADSSIGGGSWNGPVDSRTREFAYVAIPESLPVHKGLEKPYSSLSPELRRFNCDLPTHLRLRDMHLDPDFGHLTYGDQGEKANQLRANLNRDDALVFYAGLADIHGARELVYAIVGIFMVHDMVLAADIRPEERDANAHSRRVLTPGAKDLVVRGRPGMSGRMKYCLPFGEYRDRAYRVRRDLLAEWGGLSIKDGYLQRSARFPLFSDPTRFLAWLEQQKPILVQANN